MWCLVDVGGTKTRVALTTDRQTFGQPRVFPTPLDYQSGFGQIKLAVGELAGGGKLQGLIVGVPGVFDRAKTQLIQADNLPDWVGRSLTSEWAKEFAAAVHFENDAALVGLGEAVSGAGRGAAIVAYLTISTGVGGAKIEHGRIDQSAQGFEPGKEIINLTDNQTLESLVSGAALERRLGRPPNQVTDAQVWTELAHHLAVGVHNAILHWSPDLVVLGGSMIIKTPGIKLSEVITELTRLRTTLQLPLVPVVAASLGDFGGLYGGLALLNSKSVF